MDCKTIEILEIVNLTSGKSLNWSLFTEHQAASALGTPLVIDLDKPEYKLNEEFVLKIKYSTLKESEGVQWLNFNQTHSQKYPFMFTQSEPILGRSLFPCQVFYIV